MGWWAMKSADAPGFSTEPSDLRMGDVPADIMAAALNDLIAEYKEYWDRPPYEEELLGCFNFCLGGIREELSKKEEPVKNSKENNENLDPEDRFFKDEVIPFAESRREIRSHNPPRIPTLWYNQSELEMMARKAFRAGQLAEQQEQTAPNKSTSQKSYEDRRVVLVRNAEEYRQELSREVRKVFSALKLPPRFEQIYEPKVEEAINNWKRAVAVYNNCLQAITAYDEFAQYSGLKVVEEELGNEE